MHTPRHYLLDHFFGVWPAMTFLATRHRYYSLLKPAPTTADTEDVVATLRRNGVAVIPNLLPAEVVERMRQNVPPRAEFSVSPEGDRSLMFRDAHHVDALSPFFENSFLASVVRSYISAQAIPLRRTIGWKVARGEFRAFETNYHIDTWKHRVKIFFYLDDVGEENAPTVYLRGSHRGAWRLWTEQRIFRYYRTDPNGFAAGGEDFYFLGSFWPHEVLQLKNDKGFDELKCVGRAGTAVIFDGRGLHRATPLREGHRLILTSYWIHPGHHT